MQFCDRFGLVFGVRSDLGFGCIGLRLVLTGVCDWGIVDWHVVGMAFGVWFG